MRLYDEDKSLAANVAEGWYCYECLEPFVKAHGHPVSCTYCFARLSLDEQKLYPKATHEEAARVHFIKQARERKARRA